MYNFFYEISEVVELLALKCNESDSPLIFIGCVPIFSYFASEGHTVYGFKKNPDTGEKKPGIQSSKIRKKIIEENNQKIYKASSESNNLFENLNGEQVLNTDLEFSSQKDLLNLINNKKT
ncbi:hypothetical protein AYI68_g5367 [Smittium mucronatum]|uniref:Uncharacterized protein n=1 Tax=Smittium mucronatum TaxID=133383 RepID=A0A1R0GUH4_9FUNG|nr:hypothetical protein AYI68_g5367 [Smittium mucronatum]